jgi:tetratricopeptide (TPR) repeat protein
MAALNNKAHLLATSGDYEGATALVEEAIGIAEQTGYRHHRAALLNHLADLHHRSGRRAEAEQALTEAVTIFADIDSGDWRPEVWLLRQW